MVWPSHGGCHSRHCYQIPLVDIWVEVRDARVVTFICNLRSYPSARRVIVLNKIDLASRSCTKEWIEYFDQRNWNYFGVNSHNKDSVKEDFMVHNVRRALFNSISSFEGDFENENELARLIKTELISLREALRVLEEGNEAHIKVCVKLLNLYRTGRLGHFTLDKVPTNDI